MSATPAIPTIEMGGFRITLAREDIYWWDGGAMFGVVPKTLWSQKSPPDDLNRLPLGFNCYIVETGEHTILLDTGGGDKLDARRRERMKLPPTPVPLPDTIAAAGIDPERIDIVVNSHLHWDHCGWNTILTQGVPRSTIRGAASGSTPTAAIRATAWPTSTRITIRWWMPGACACWMRTLKSRPVSGCAWRPGTRPT